MKEVKEANERHLQEWKDSMMLAVYVDVYDTGRAKTIRIARDLEEYYRLIGCDTVTMPMRYIGGKQFIIIADDEGTFRKDCRVSAMNGDDPMLVGNLLVVAFDGVEDIRGLTREEADHVLRHTKGRPGLKFVKSTPFETAATGILNSFPDDKIKLSIACFVGIVTKSLLF